MLQFFRAPVVTITNIDQTLTSENSIAVAAGDKVIIDILTPTAAGVIHVYRSDSPGAETLWMSVPLTEPFRKRENISVRLQVTDEGPYAAGVTPSYPTSTTLTPTEQAALPVPTFSLSAVAGGGFAAGTVYYRVSFQSVADVVPTFSSKDAHVKLYKPDLTEALIFSREDLTTEAGYTLEVDPLAYAEAILGGVFVNYGTVGTELRLMQEVKQGQSFINKVIAYPIPVTLSTGSVAVIAGVPVVVMTNPPDVEVEFLENGITGVYPQKLSGNNIFVFPDPGSVTFNPTSRMNILFAFSGASFRVV